MQSFFIPNSSYKIIQHLVVEQGDMNFGGLDFLLLL